MATSSGPPRILAGLVTCLVLNLAASIVASVVAVLTATLAAALVTAMPARAASPPIVLEGRVPTPDLRGHLDIHVESPESFAERADGGGSTGGLQPADFAGPDAVPVRPVADKWVDLGYTPARIWVRFGLINGTQVTGWRLHFRENFKQEFAVFALRGDGTIDTLIEIDRRSPFGARPVAYPEMVAPLELAPGEAVDILVRYRSEGSSFIAFGIETVESFAAITTARTAKNYIFYGMMLLLIAVALVALAVFRNVLFASYAAYSGAALLYMVHSDGVAFQHLWPNWPAFNSMASVVAGTGIIVFGAIYARLFLRTRRFHPILDKALLGLIVVTLALDAALWLTDPQLLKKLLIVLSLVAVLMFAVSGIVASVRRFRQVRFYVVAWLGVVASALLLNFRHVLGIELSQDLQFDSMRGAMVFDALMMGLAIADRYNYLRRSQQSAMRESLAQARENVELAGRLSALEGRYERAVALARQRGENLQNAAHDLQQPMQALRLSLRRLTSPPKDTGDGSPRPRGAERTRDIEASLAYMEQLVERQLEDEGRHVGVRSDGPPVPVRPDDQSSASTERAPERRDVVDPLRERADADEDKDAAASPPAHDAVAMLGVHEVLRNVHAMFAPEAVAKGLPLRLRLAAPDRPVPAFALMRVLANLVSNAIKFSGQHDGTREGRGGVVIGLRARGGALRIEVHDTGPGLDAAAFERALARRARLSPAGDVEGSGLGLAIAREVAAREGWRLSLSGLRRTGTGVVVELGPSATATRAATHAAATDEAVMEDAMDDVMDDAMKDAVA